MGKPIVVVTEGLEPGPLAWLREHAELREVSWKETEKLREALADADGLIVRTYTRVTPELLDAGPKLRAVGRAGVGLDNIDQPACAARGIKVLSTPTANTRAVCEYVFNLIFHLGRPLVNLSAAVSEEAFHAYRKKIRGLELAGKTMGIVGMGNIGRGVGKIAWAMQMKVIYNDLIDVSGRLDYPATSVTKEELYRQADVVTVHVNHQPNNLNYHLIGAKEFGTMKAGVYFLNTCRGEVVDAVALAEALRSGHVAGAAVDVHDPEPPRADYPLFGCPNIIIAPHMAARTQGAMEQMSWVARLVVEALEK